MIGMKTGICNRHDFAFEVVAGKPILFIHKWNDNPFVLKIAVNILKTFSLKRQLIFLKQIQLQH